MFQLVQRRRWYFALSALVIVPGLLLMVFQWVTTGAPFRLGVDFAGGSIYDLRFTQPGVDEAALRAAFDAIGQDGAVIQAVGAPESYRWSVRSGFVESAANEQLLASLGALAPLDADALRIENVSPSVGAEVTRAAFFAVLVAAAVVTGFIVLAFRQVPNAWRYGVCAVVAMVHDLLVMLSAMSLFGLLLGWEVDALFLTSVLTVLGFSVQDSIVVFDRIRENIPKHLGEPYETIVNRSILETIHRSLATQLNAFFIMIAILLFGGDTIRQFIALLFIGLLSGTYSSIFTAVPLLVAWQKGELPFTGGERSSAPPAVGASA